MSHLLARMGSVTVTAEANGCWVRPDGPGYNVADRRSWPRDAMDDPVAEQVSLDVEQILEQGLGEAVDGAVRVPYESFAQLDELGFQFGTKWCAWSPFLLTIDRAGDLGRPDFEYRYYFREGVRSVAVDRLGCFIFYRPRNAMYRLDGSSYRLVEEMDGFNTLPAEERKAQGWRTFASVKGLSAGIGAELDAVLRANDVVVPANIGLEMRSGAEGLTFVPTCREAGAGFGEAFLRSTDVRGVYAVDAEGGRRVRVVLGDRQREALGRMKRVWRLQGPDADQLLKDPTVAFDGLMDVIELSYGPRVTGIGPVDFAPTPRRAAGVTHLTPVLEGSGDVSSDDAWRDGSAPRITVRLPGGGDWVLDTSDENARRDLQEAVRQAEANGNPVATFRGQEIVIDKALIAALEATATSALGLRAPDGVRYLQIKDNKTSVSATVSVDTDRGMPPLDMDAFQLPFSVAEAASAKEHQRDGVRWLATCARLQARKGALLADDMGMGKTFQILAFIAHAIENRLYPELAREHPPWRPVLVVLPLILLENETWQSDMRRFFRNDGADFEPVLSLHGPQLKNLRVDSPGREVVVGRPLLDLDQLQQYRVVLTTYETVVNYQHSFACLRAGKSLWSVVVTDEAQEYKTPSTKTSHAIKALAPDFRVASTGTPVENRLLDVWNILDALQPGHLGAAKHFAEEFEDACDAGGERASAALKTLKGRLRFGEPDAFVIRREKAGTPGLPRRFEHRLRCDLTDREVTLHKDVVAAARAAGGTRSQGATFRALHRLSLLYQHPRLLEATGWESDADGLVASSSKLQAVIAELHRIRSRGEKAVIFARHIPAQQMLARCLTREFGLPVRIVNGEVAGSARAARGKATRREILSEFREAAGFALIVLSPFVAGVGLTIVEANHVFHYGRWWNPAVEAQATDRVYRIGQERDVHVYLPILCDPLGRLPKTFDEALDEILNAKAALAHDFLRPMEAESHTAGVLFGALESLGETPAPASLAVSEIGGLSVEDLVALVAVGQARAGWEVQRPRAGDAPGAELVARKQGRFRVLVVRQVCTAVEVIAIARSARERITRKEGVSGEAAVWTPMKFADDAFPVAQAAGVSLVSGDSFRDRLSDLRATRAEMWAMGDELYRTAGC